MTTKTIAEMIAEFPEEPNPTPSDGPIGDEHDRIHIARWKYRRLLAKVALLRAALDGLLKVQWQASIDWGCRTDYDNARDEAQEALEVTRGS